MDCSRRLVDFSQRDFIYSTSHRPPGQAWVPKCAILSLLICCPGEEERIAAPVLGSRVAGFPGADCRYRGESEVAEISRRYDYSVALGCSGDQRIDGG